MLSHTRVRFVRTQLGNTSSFKITLSFPRLSGQILNRDQNGKCIAIAKDIFLSKWSGLTSN